MTHDLTEGQLQELAAAAHGFVGADLAALVQEAAMTALRRIIAARKPEALQASAGQQNALQRFGGNTEKIRQRHPEEVSGVLVVPHRLLVWCQAQDSFLVAQVQP